MQNIPVRHINSNVKEPNTPGDFVIWSLSELLSGVDMLQELHRHDFYFILVVEKGTGEHIIDFTVYPVTNQSIFIMRPGQVHELKLNSGCKGYLLQFTDHLCAGYDTLSKNILKRISLQNHYLPGTENMTKIRLLMKTLLQENSERETVYEYAIPLNIQLFFIELLRQKNTQASTHNERTSYQQERLDEFRELVAEHMFEHKQVSWYANKMNLSVYQLNTISKTALSKSSSAIINDYIVLEARRYLLATTNQVNQISLHLGFEDVSYFIRFFKKHTGFSPEAYRNNFK